METPPYRRRGMGRVRKKLNQGPVHRRALSIHHYVQQSGGGAYLNDIRTLQFEGRSFGYPDSHGHHVIRSKGARMMSVPYIYCRMMCPALTRSD